MAARRSQPLRASTWPVRQRPGRGPGRAAQLLPARQFALDQHQSSSPTTRGRGLPRRLVTTDWVEFGARNPVRDARGPEDCFWSRRSAPSVEKEPMVRLRRRRKSLNSGFPYSCHRRKRPNSVRPPADGPRCLSRRNTIPVRVEWRTADVSSPPVSLISAAAFVTPSFTALRWAAVEDDRRAGDLRSTRSPPARAPRLLTRRPCSMRASSLGQKEIEAARDRGRNATMASSRNRFEQRLLVIRLAATRRSEFGPAPRLIGREQGNVAAFARASARAAFWRRGRVGTWVCVRWVSMSLTLVGYEVVGIGRNEYVRIIA